MSRFLSVYEADINELTFPADCDIITEGFLSDVIKSIRVAISKAFKALCKIIVAAWNAILKGLRIARTKIMAFIDKVTDKPKENLPALMEYSSTVKTDGKVIDVDQLSAEMEELHMICTTQLRKILMTGLSDTTTYTKKIDAEWLLTYMDFGANERGVIQYPKAKIIAQKKYQDAEDADKLVTIDDLYVMKFRNWLDKNLDKFDAYNKESIKELGSLEHEISKYFGNARVNSQSVDQLTPEQSEVLIYNRNILYSATGFVAEKVRSINILIEDSWDAVLDYSWKRLKEKL